MAVTKYSYVKEVDIPRLLQEIAASAIVHTVDHITLAVSALDIYMKDAISAGDKTVLDGLVTSHVNTPLPEITQQFDVDGAAYSRKKITENGDHFQSRFISFETATKDSVVVNGYDGTPTGEAIMKFFDKAGADITASPQSDIYEKCIRTEVDITPPFDFKIMKGAVTLDHETSDRKALLYCRMAPDLGPVYGEKDMIHGLPLRSVKAGEWKIFDGEAPKPIVQALFGGTANFRQRIWHSPGSQIIVIAEFILFKN